MTPVTNIPEVTAAIEEFVKAVKGEEVVKVAEPPTAGASYISSATTSTSSTLVGNTPF